MKINAELLSRLDNSPVAGVPMGNVSLLRLDKTGGRAPGNKWFKLQGNLEQAKQLGVSRLVSFGGAWSNHLHALAAVGREQGFQTIGIVRGESGPAESAMLADARAWGMQIVPVSRSEYRRRSQGEYLQQIQRRFDPCLVIPEGGGNTQGVRGCLKIAEIVLAVAPTARRIVLPVGTGTTLAGLVAGLPGDYQVTGISALKGAADLERRIEAAMPATGTDPAADWRLLHDYHCGGFARVNAPLREFMLAFERVQGVALDPVYTGKMLFAIHQRLKFGQLEPTEPLLAIHTGGLQGRRGFDWLS